MADAQQLQGPLVHRIKALAGAGGRIAAETQGRERLHANPLTAEPVGAQLVTGLQEGQGHALGLLAGAVNAGHAIEHLQAGALGAQGWIQQHGVAGGQAHGGNRGVGKEAETHGHRTGAYCE